MTASETATITIRRPLVLATSCHPTLAEDVAPFAVDLVVLVLAYTKLDAVHCHGGNPVRSAVLCSAQRPLACADVGHNNAVAPRLADGASGAECCFPRFCSSEGGGHISEIKGNEVRHSFRVTRLEERPPAFRGTQHVQAWQRDAWQTVSAEYSAPQQRGQDLRRQQRQRHQHLQQFRARGGVTTDSSLSSTASTETRQAAHQTRNLRASTGS
jgi:hypothetical protein